MKHFESPVIELIVMDVEDIVTASGDELPEDEWE